MRNVAFLLLAVTAMIGASATAAFTVPNPSGSSAKTGLENLAANLVAASGRDLEMESVIEAFAKAERYQTLTPIQVSTGSSGYIVCAGINWGVFLNSEYAGVCSDLSGRLYHLRVPGLGVAFILSANVLLGYAQTNGDDLSGEFGWAGDLEPHLEGSVGGAWLLIGGRVVYFRGQGQSYLVMGGWEVGSGIGFTSGNSKVSLVRKF